MNVPVNQAFHFSTLTAARVPKVRRKWFDEPAASYPPDIHDKTLKMLAARKTDDDENAVVEWNNSFFSESSWAEIIADWKAKYPNILVTKDGKKTSIPETDSLRRA